MKRIILSGPSASGKTATMLLLEKMAMDEGRNITGLICSPVFADGIKTAIEWKAAGAGAKAAILAQLASDAASKTQGSLFIDGEKLNFGKWIFDMRELGKADRQLHESILLAAKADHPVLVLADEIGPLELKWQSGFYNSFLEMDRLGAGLKLCMLVAARPDIAVMLKNRWPDSQIIHLEYGKARECAGQIHGVFC